MDSNKRKKHIFLDIDGTIYSGMGFIPDSAKCAIRKARKNGHKVYLSTGRNRAEISEDLWNLGIDGIIASAGAYVEVGGEVLYHQPLEEQLLVKLYDYLLNHNIMFSIETNDLICGLESHIKVQKDLFEHIRSKKLTAVNTDLKPTDDNEQDPFESGINSFIKLLTVVEDVRLVENANKILFYRSPIPVKQIQEDIGQLFTVIYGTVDFLKGESGEIYAKSISKATGIEKLIRHLNAEQEDTVAFGDGLNDIEMIEYAGIGIAMGNAVEELKKVADIVTEEVSKDGLHHGFMNSGLI